MHRYARDLERWRAGGEAHSAGAPPSGDGLAVRIGLVSPGHRLANWLLGHLVWVALDFVCITL